MSLKTKGIIIRKLNYADNDVIFDLLCENGEILAFIAKGARRIKSRFAGVIQLGLVVDIVYTKGKSLSYPSEITLDKLHLTTFYSRSLSHMNFYTDVITITRLVAKDLQDSSLFYLVTDIFQNVEKNINTLVDNYNQFLSGVLELISTDYSLRCYMTGREIREPEFYYSASSNKVFSVENKPSNVDLSKVIFDENFYREYLQKLLSESLHRKLSLKFR